VPKFSETLIVGCGNPLFADDGFGPAVIEEIQKFSLPENICIVDAGLGGPHFIFPQIDPEVTKKLIVVCAADFGAEPGSIAKFRVEDLPPGSHRDAHSWDLTEPLERIKGKVEIIILGCQPKRVTNDFEIGISDEVSRAIPKTVQILLDMIGIDWQQIQSDQISNEKNIKNPQFCNNCGIKFSRSTTFCPECGIKITHSNPAMVTTSGQSSKSNPEPATSIIKKDEIVTMYDNNAFRILGIEGNVNRKTLRNVQQSSKARAKLGGPINTIDPLSFLNVISRDENSLRDAQNRIEISRSRIIERFCWFFNTNQNDAEALDKLKDGHYNDAVKIWNASDELSSSINLAILYHAYYISKDISAVNTEKWTRVFERWQNLINNEKYWIFLETIEQQSEFEPLATHDDFDTLKTDIWKILIKPNIDCMKKARDTNLDDIVQRHFELIRTSNFPARIIAEVEYEIFSPLEGKINEELEEIGKTVFENKKSSRSKLEKKIELDRILEAFRMQTSKKINRFLRLIRNDSDFAKNIREKTASCLREISISYHNDAESLELSEIVLKEAKFNAEGTSLLTQITEDLLIISKHVKDAREFEKFAEYSEKIGNYELSISKTQISFKNQIYKIQDITGIRYGIFQESVNGIPTSRSYAIWLKSGNIPRPVKSTSGYIPPVTPVENVMMIECADATWFGVDKIQNRFNEIVNRLYHLIQVPLVNKMIQDFESGKRVYVSNIIIDFTGIYKDFNYDPLSKGLIGLSAKFLGTKDIEMKEGKHKHLSWNNYHGYNTSNGKIWIFDDNKSSWISLSARDDWNANNLSYFFDYMNKDNNLAQSIEKCISGVTAVKDDQCEVIKTLDNSLAIDPKNWLTWWQKGQALKNLGRFEEALTAFDRVLEIIPKDPNVWNTKGLTLIEVNKENEALDCFERALVIDSQLSHVWYNKGMTFERIGNYKESVRAIDRSLAIKFDSNIKDTRDRISTLIGAK
jgi:coenzyme F420 hydrogenase subunit delta